MKALILLALLLPMAAHGQMSDKWKDLPDTLWVRMTNTPVNDPAFKAWMKAEIEKSVVPAQTQAGIICPVCKDRGQKSTVFEGMGESTLAMGYTYYDENGVRHSDDPNIYTTRYRCSNGHRWAVKSQRGLEWTEIDSTTFLQLVQPLYRNPDWDKIQAESMPPGEPTDEVQFIRDLLAKICEGWRLLLVLPKADTTVQAWRNGWTDFYGRWHFRQPDTTITDRVIQWPEE